MINGKSTPSRKAMYAKYIKSNIFATEPSKTSSTNPVKKVVGEVVVKNILIDTPLNIWLKTKEKSVEILLLQPQNGKKIDIKSFLNGYKQKSMMVSDAS